VGEKEEDAEAEEEERGGMWEGGDGVRFFF
jgi:hypothetical protein